MVILQNIKRKNKHTCHTFTLLRNIIPLLTEKELGGAALYRRKANGRLCFTLVGCSWALLLGLWSINTRSYQKKELSILYILYALLY